MSTVPASVNFPSPVQSGSNAQPPSNGFESAQVNNDISLLKYDDYISYASRMLAAGQAVTPTTNNNTMTGRKISAEAAGNYGLDQDEAHLALLYAAASKQATQHGTTATPDELKQLSNMARLQGLALDLYQRVKAAVLLPQVPENERQYHMASQLRGTFQELHKLEKTLFGQPRTPKDDLVKKAGGQTTAWRRAQQESETPTTPNSTSRGAASPHFAA